MDEVTLLYNPEEIQEISVVLNQTFTKDRLVYIFANEIRPFMITHNARIIYGGKLAAMHGLFQKHKTIQVYSLSKDVLLQYAALMLCQTNLMTWFNLLSNKQQEAWLLVLRNIFVKTDTFAKLIKVNIESRRNIFYRNYYNELPWLERMSVFDNPSQFNTCDYLYIPHTLLQYFNQILQADEQLKGERPEFEQQPDSVVNAETLSQTIWPIIVEYLQQGIITIGKTKLLTATAIKTISSHALNVLPTPAGAYHDEHLFARLLGTIVACDFNSLFIWEKQNSKEPHKVLKSIFGNLAKPSAHLVPLLTSHINGISSSDRQECRLTEITATLNSVIKIHQDEWLTCEQLCDEYRIINRKQSTMTGFLPRTRWSSQALITRRDKHLICADEMVRYIGIPMIKGLLMMYCAMGLVEISFEPVEEKDSISPFDCITAIRLTALGHYAMGNTNKYTPPKVETKKAFEASRTKLIIRVLDENTPYLSLLGTMATSIGNNRWLVTAKDMLTGCDSKEALQNKIDSFKHYVEPDPAPVWQTFFCTMLNRCKPLKKEPLNNKYYLYSLDPDNHELIELFTTDTVIRSLIIRAENMLVLVPIENYAKLVKRCREFGYLI